MKGAISSLAGRIPLKQLDKITDKIQTFKKAVLENPSGTYELAEVVEILDEHKKILSTDRQR